MRQLAGCVVFAAVIWSAINSHMAGDVGRSVLAQTCPPNGDERCKPPAAPPEQPDPVKSSI